ncbi:LPS assembly lipoprotein LptE [Deferrisoma camini]|uniref:LPS assembly lipoprotein LptE n=1 Tax=Deferrisoma camini TaxID=1035120 RepID=UPI00046D0551|nr:LPS assembly lipoprotein LptE [Deferrisoma camini]
MRRWAGLVALVVLAAGCGYRLAGRPGDAVATVRIEPVDDRAAEPLFGPLLARAMAREVVDRGDLRLGRGPAADLVVRVRVDEVTESGAAYGAGGLVEYRVRARVTATVADRAGRVQWRGTLEEDREFPAGADVNATERAKDQALEALASDLARAVLRRASIAALGEGS